jgi:hypothetical protein
MLISNKHLLSYLRGFHNNRNQARKLVGHPFDRSD